MSASESKAGTGRSSLLVVVKGEHKYLVKYRIERRMELFDHLLEYGMDDNYNLTTFDALTLIEKLQEKKEEASVVSLSDDQPALEGESGLEGRAGDMNGPPTGRGV